MKSPVLVQIRPQGKEARTQATMKTGFWAGLKMEVWEPAVIHIPMLLMLLAYPSLTTEALNLQ